MKDNDWFFNSITKEGRHKSGLAFRLEKSSEPNTANVGVLNEISWSDNLSEQGYSNEDIDKLLQSISQEYVSLCQNSRILNHITNFHIPTKEEKIQKILAFKERSRRLGNKIMEQIKYYEQKRWRD